MRPLTGRVLRGMPVAGADGVAEANIRAALERGLPEFHPAIVEHNGSFVLVGSGPSLPSMVEEIRKEYEQDKTICAVKGAHDLLIENGIEPHLFVSCEPRYRPLKTVSKKCAYLIASRCPPELFDQLKDARVILWHSWASLPGAPEVRVPNPQWDDFYPAPECEAWRGKGEGVGGGSTSGLRAMMIAYLMGYRRMTLYGMDSCLGPDKYTKKFTGENIGRNEPIDVIAGGKRFWCNAPLADQAIGFEKMSGYFQKHAGVKFEVKGGGLLAEILKVRAAKS